MKQKSTRRPAQKRKGPANPPKSTAEHACLAHSHAPVRLSELAKLAAKPRALDRAARLFFALGDPARLRLLVLLEAGERCVGELVEVLGEKFPTISQRLRLLRSEGLVVRRRDGNHLHYALADSHVAVLLRNALDHAAELASGPLDGGDQEDGGGSSEV